MRLVIKACIILLLSVIAVNAQELQAPKTSKGLVKSTTYNGNNNGVDRSLGENTKSTKAIKIDTKASDYKFISIDNDTTYIDTTLSIKKEYKHNYLKKDYFELLPFSNTGQVFNQLGYDFTENTTVFSRFGARAKHSDFAEVNDIYYYNVATPLTELFFKTTMEQGQLAEGFFTVNTTPNFNVAIAFKGLRSLGKYRHIKANSGKFRTSLNYQTNNQRYVAKGHVVIQSIENEENGGITDLMVDAFESEDPEFNDRSRFEVNFEDAKNKLSAKRFYINHYYNIVKPKDSSSNYRLSVGHISNLKDKKYEFSQNAANTFFGDAFRSSIRDEVRLEQFYNQGYLALKKDGLGQFKAHVGYTDYNYGYNSIVNLTNGYIPNRLKSSFASYGVAYKNNFGKLLLRSEYESNLSKTNKGSRFNALAGYKVNADIAAKVKMAYNESLPDFNYRLFQSDYKNYNWFNPELQTQQTYTVSAEIDAEKYISVKGSYTTLNNYTYFGIDNLTAGVKPFQEKSTISYLKLSANKEFKYRKWALDNKVQYQSVMQENEVLNLPEVIVRNTLYYSDELFNKNLFLQTGLVFNYFTAYKMNAYDPLLSEFYVQTQNEYGAYPRLDFFVNAKVRNARMYLKAEHFNSSFTGNNFYSAPNYPYKDFTVRFGIIWDFFL
ncbi:MAG: putative porin [Flavobacteriaceae bacterium]